MQVSDFHLVILLMRPRHIHALHVQLSLNHFISLATIPVGNYRKVMGTKHGHDLLRTYSSNMSRGIGVIEGSFNRLFALRGPSLTHSLTYAKGWPISSYMSGKSLFLVANGTKRQIGDMDTFNALGFDLQHVLLVSDDLFNALPAGPPLPHS